MNIGIDGRSLLEHRWGGVSWYTYHMVKAIMDQKAEHAIKLFFNASDIFKRQNISHLNSNHKLFSCPNKLLFAMMKLIGAPEIDKLLFGNNHCDMVWLPNWNIERHSNRTGVMLTVHDLSMIHYPYHYTMRQRLWHWLIECKQLCRRADHILAVSNWTKYDLVNTLNIAEEKITVIPEGVAKPDIPDECAISLQLPKHYILAFDGSARKNIQTVINALRLLGNPIPLVLIGSTRQTANVISLPYISEQEKWFILSRAEALVFPSLYEGFGLPVLEAMACGCPVIASSVTSLPEIVANAGLLVYPYNTADWAGAVEAVINDDHLRLRLSRDGKEQSTSFCWNKSAEEWWRVMTRFTL